MRRWLRLLIGLGSEEARLTGKLSLSLFRVVVGQVWGFVGESRGGLTLILLPGGGEVLQIRVCFCLFVHEMAFLGGMADTWAGEAKLVWGRPGK